MSTAEGSPDWGRAPRVGVLLISFGEPDTTSVDEAIPYLERIFLHNASLMGQATPERIRERSRQLAEERAPGLVEAYRLIGGSPLHAQARVQATSLEAEIRRRSHDDAFVLVGMQFTEPSIEVAVADARAMGAERLVVLPVYPLSGPSTTVAAFAEFDAAIERLGWRVPVSRIAGWHADAAYLRLRANAIREVLDANGLSFANGTTRLVFSAHGTPMKYLESDDRYNRHVKDHCAALALAVGAGEYRIGYQNHANRPSVEWTQPDVEQVIAEIDAERVVVDAVSFMHEQSETLAELDHELRSQAESRGMEFYRVPIPYGAPAFIGLLADLVAPRQAPARPTDSLADLVAAPSR